MGMLMVIRKSIALLRPSRRRSADLVFQVKSKNCNSIESWETLQQPPQFYMLILHPLPLEDFIKR